MKQSNLFRGLIAFLFLLVFTTVDAQKFTGALRYPDLATLQAYVPDLTRSNSVLAVVVDPTGVDASVFYIWDKKTDAWIIASSGEEKHFANIAAIPTSLSLGERIKIEDTGAEYFVQSTTVAGYNGGAADGVAVIDLGGSKYAVIQKDNKGYNVNWFGAVPNDALSDVVAFEKAFEFSTDIYVNKGDYNVKNIALVGNLRLEILEEAAIKGITTSDTIFIADGLTNTVTIFGKGEISFAGIGIYHFGTSSINGSVFRDFKMTSLDKGMELATSVGNKFIDLRFQSDIDTCLHFANEGQCNLNTIERCKFLLYNDVAILFDGTSSSTTNTINNCWIEDSSGKGLVFNNAINHLIVSNNYFETCAGSGNYDIEILPLSGSARAVFLQNNSFRTATVGQPARVLVDNNAALNMSGGSAVLGTGMVLCDVKHFGGAASFRDIYLNATGGGTYESRLYLKEGTPEVSWNNYVSSGFVTGDEVIENDFGNWVKADSLTLRQGLILEDYGSGTRTGTAAKYLAVEADGDVIEVDGSSIGQLKYFTNIAAIPTSLSLGERIKLEDKGAEYFVQSTTVAGYNSGAADGVAVIDLGSGKYAKLQDESGSVQVEHFGAIANDGLADDVYFQNAADYAAAAGIGKIKIGTGDFHFDKGFVIRDTIGGAYSFLSLEIEGANYAYASLNKESTQFLINDGNTFGIGVELGRNVKISNIVFKGQAVSPSTFKTLIEGHDWTNGGVARDNRYSPHAAIVVDPFHTSVPIGSRYPDYGTDDYDTYNGGSNSGTSMLKIEGCSFLGFIVDIMVSPNGSTNNCDNITAVNCRSGGSKTFWATGQNQSRANSIVNCYNVGYLDRFIDGDMYGSQQGTAPIVFDCNIAAGVKTLFSFNGGFTGVYFSHSYIESVFSLGKGSTTVPTVFNSTRVKFHIPTETFLPPYIFKGGMFSMEGGSLEYFSNCTTLFPFGFSTGTNSPTFQNVLIEGGLIIREYSNSPSQNLGDTNFLDVVDKCNTIINNNKKVLGTAKTHDSQTYSSMQGYAVLANNVYNNVNFSSGRAKIETENSNYFVEGIGSNSLTVDSVNLTATFTSTDSDVIKVGDIITSTYSNSGNILGMGSFQSPLGVVTDVTGTTVTIEGLTYNHTLAAQSMYLVRLHTFSWAFFGDIETGQDTIFNVKYAQTAPKVGQTITRGQKNEGLKNGTYITAVNTSLDYIVISSPATSTKTGCELVSVNYTNTRSNKALYEHTSVAHKKGDRIENNGINGTEIIEWVCTKGGIVGSGVEPEFVAINGLGEWEKTGTELKPISTTSKFLVEGAAANFESNLNGNYSDSKVNSQSANALIFANGQGSTQNTYYKPQSVGFGTIDAGRKTYYGSFRASGGGGSVMNYSINGANTGFEITYNENNVAYFDENKRFGIGTITPQARLDIEGGNVRFSDYGTGTVTGTAAKYLAVEADGDVIEVDAPTAANLYSADGTLTGNRTINSTGQTLTYSATDGNDINVSSFEDNNVSFVLNNTGTSELGTFTFTPTALKSSSASVLIVNNDSEQLVLGDNENNNTTKKATVSGLHYASAEEPTSMLYAQNSSAGNSLRIGGGNLNENAATTIDFHTAPNTTTAVGTRVMRIDINQNIQIGTPVATGEKLHIEGDVRIEDVLKLDPLSVVPAAPNTGTLYMDDGSNTGGTPALRYYNGTSWITL